MHPRDPANGTHFPYFGLVLIMFSGRSVSSFVNGEQAVSFDVTTVLVDEFDKFKPRLKR